MKQFFTKMCQTMHRLTRNEGGVSALEFTLIVALVAVAVLASLDSTSDTLELLLTRLASGLAP